MGRNFLWYICRSICTVTYLLISVTSLMRSPNAALWRKTTKLHWLPVHQRVDFKVATLVHQSLSGISPPYLADDCRFVADARERRLRSTESRTCIVTRTYSTFGDRAFGAAGPGLWNSLPSHLKDADLSYSKFRRSLDISFWTVGSRCSVNSF